MPRTRLDPKAWNPPPRPDLDGPYAPNRALEAPERWSTPGEGPEDVVAGHDGGLYTGLADGRVVRFPPDGGAARTVATVPGRPLGIERDPRGGLIVCSAGGGLLHLDPDTGAVTTVVDRVDGAAMRFTNNAACAADGRIFFTDSSRRFGFDDFMADILEHSRTGRLLVHDRRDGSTRVLLDGLAFANGVALASDESYVLVAETAAYRVTRWWLDGPRRRDTYEPFLDNLPGLPDNLTTGPDGLFWVAFVNPRDAVLDRLLPHPLLRRGVWALPERLRPAPTRYGFVVAYDERGGVVHNLQGPSGEAYARITSARVHDGWLWLGSLDEHAIARVPAPA